LPPSTSIACASRHSASPLLGLLGVRAAACAALNSGAVLV
jgi:hypothetical protein